MSRSRKRASTAAYAASQPLFDALRLGCERIEQQKVQLEAARDLVQRLHVKVPVTDTSDEALEHEQYISCAVRALNLAMDGYATVFEALATVTAADVSEGREQREGHDSFVAMAKYARLAEEVSHLFKIESAEEATGRQQTPVGRKRSRSDGTTVENAHARSSKSRKVSDVRPKSGKRSLSGGATSTVTPSGDQRRPQYDVRPGEAAQNHKDHLAAKREKKPFSVEVETSDPPFKVEEAPVEDKSKPEFERDYLALDMGAEPLPLRTELRQHKQAGVEYDDVSAEVEARLKTKEEKRKAKGKEKKRKRKSDQSVPGAEAEEKQAKKKSKHAGESTIRGGANGNANAQKGGPLSKAKRKEQDDDGQQDRKKRKKST